MTAFSAVMLRKLVSVVVTLRLDPVSLSLIRKITKTIAVFGLFVFTARNLTLTVVSTFSVYFKSVPQICIMCVVGHFKLFYFGREKAKPSDTGIINAFLTRRFPL